MKTIAGKKALVTGAASGLGRAIAWALAREQAELCLLDVDGPRLEALAAELRDEGVRVLAWQCDLTDRDDLDACLNQLLVEWRGVDIVVNNAGKAYLGPTTSMSDQQWDSLLGVNLLAPVQIIRRLLPTLKERGDAQIVNIASVAGLVGFSRIAAYCLTKFGLVGFSEALRSELARFGVGVTVVCPGLVRTNLFRSTMTRDPNTQVRTPPSWLCTEPQVVADRVIHAIRKNRALVVPSLLANCLWMIHRLSPNLLSGLFGGYRSGPRRAAPELVPAREMPAAKPARLHRVPV